MLLLDTDTCVHILRARQPYLGCYAEVEPGTAFISTVTYHELYYGALHAGSTKERHLQSLEDFVNQLVILPFTPASAARSAEVREALAARGTLIGPLDALIAGHALEHELTLVTGNTREFSRVDGLITENWCDS
jgi:tRNA(fMet)-specific endonuclease VapC